MNSERPASLVCESPTHIRWAATLLGAAVIAAYAGSFGVPFLFDDQPSIAENPSLHHFRDAFFPPHGRGLTVEGRPLLNLTLALNNVISGPAVWSYHALNLVFHTLATLTLFGLIRRTLSKPSTLTDRSSTPVAFAAALLWGLHPLHTESVTYIVQRAESLMGLFYLATLYFFRRGAESPLPAHRRRWFGLAVIACALGLATKEVMVTAPLIVWLYDRTFMSGSFRDAWRRHGHVHFGLASTWLLLVFLVVGAGDRGGTIGSAAGIAWWEYALSQSFAVLHYLRLALWPSPLIFDYGPNVLSFREAMPFLIAVSALLGLTGYALWRRPALGFLGAWFFVMLAPTSSVVGGTRQMVAEHRVYLSLAAVSVLVVLGLRKFAGRRFWVAAIGFGLVLGVVTVRRNRDYTSELTLYRDTAVKRPENGFARYNLGKLYADLGRHAEAALEFQASIRLIPQAAPAHFNLANSYVELGRRTEARAQFETALQIDPREERAHFNLGNLLLQSGEKNGALEHFRSAVTINPQYLEARSNLGGVLLELGQLDAAQEQLEFVARAKPDAVEAHFGLGNIFTLRKRWDDATREFETVLRLRPDLAVARERLELVRARR